MLKKLIKVIMVFSLLLGSFYFSDVVNAKSSINKSEYIELMATVKNLVKQGKEDEAANLVEVKKFLETIKDDPSVAENFLSSLDAFNTAKVNEKLEGIEIGSNDRKIIEFDDGSFIVVQSTTDEVSSSESGISLMSVSTGTFNHTTTPGSSLHTDFQYQVWGIYLAAEFHLHTYYTINFNNIAITDTDVGGTFANFPSTISSATSSIVTNNSTSVKSKGNYTLVNGIEIGGLPIGNTIYYTLYTQIKIVNVDEKFVYYSVTNSVIK